MRKSKHHHFLLLAISFACIFSFIILFNSSLTVYAVNRSANFRKTYTITGDKARDIVSIAQAQDGLTDSTFKYGVAWCAYFVEDCARLAGAEDAIPNSFSGEGYADELRKKMINSCGARVISQSEARPGDIVFYDYQEGNPDADHVGIVVDNGGKHAAEGNIVKKGESVSKAWKSLSTSGRNSRLIFLRPNYSATTSYDPQGCTDIANGGYGNIQVRGWAFDKDNTSSPIEVHVYIGGPAGSGEGHVIKADKYRPDVNNAFNVGDYHGFSDTISTSKTGSQPIYFYAINTGGGSNVLFDQRTVTINEKETVNFGEPLTIHEYVNGGVFFDCANISYTGTIQSYGIRYKLADQTTWIEAYSNSTTKNPFSFGKTLSFEFDKKYDAYLYVKMQSGTEFKTNTVRINMETQPPIVSDMVVSNLDSDGFDFSCIITDDSAIKSVDMYSYKIEDDKNTSKHTEKVEFSDGRYHCHVSTSNHNNKTGEYKIQIIVYDKYSNFANVKKEHIIVPTWEECHQVEIKFDSQGGNSVTSVYTTLGTTIGASDIPENPTKEGFKFIGWFDKNGAEWDFAKNVVNDNPLTLYAKWEVIEPKDTPATENKEPNDTPSSKTDEPKENPATEKTDTPATGNNESPSTSTAENKESQNKPAVDSNDSKVTPAIDNIDTKETTSTETTKTPQVDSNNTPVSTTDVETTIEATSISKIKRGNKKLSVSWKSVDNAIGYEIQYSTAKSFKKNKTKTINVSAKSSATLKKLKKSKTYYVRIRAYKTVSGKQIYSSWSSIKKAKTK
ncbi:InlB B-repeat-containing protein [Butyrivibrio sp. AE3004]|uniref:InlB B-repeat-containing protein n=1 Tax=Butyrivibrio sp. AE3004 TaxID=1506994 RepID=UPI000494CE79|nr:InlB B-repeat-containing protein [Butyrivibrio sp. AE3004]